MISSCRRLRTMCHDCCTPTIPEEETTTTNEQRHSLYLSSEEDGTTSSPHAPSNTVVTQNYYYIDDFNDLSYSCTFGTSDSNGIWMNRQDPAGTMMCGIVWVLISYSIFTITLLAHYQGIPIYYSTIYSIMAVLALATHIKTSLTDPGSVPASAVPTLQQRSSYYSHQHHHKLSMCSQCQTYKPPGSHHCRICHRCISHMDHHCPWMNNCIGAGNMKHFLLFLCYTWICSVLSLSFFGYNYFFCSAPSCMYNIVLTQLVRFMTVLAIGALLFTSSMLMNVIYGIMTGIGTIDRLKKKASQTIMESEEEPIPLVHIFGMNPYYTWILPIDPIFPNYDTVMGYSTPQRLLREQMRMNTPIPVVSATNPHPHNNNHHHPATTTTNSDTPPYNNNYNHNNEQYT